MNRFLQWLSPGGRAPMLPHSLPVMATIALVPPLWFRLMNPRLDALELPDRKPAPPAQGIKPRTGLSRRIRA